MAAAPEPRPLEESWKREPVRREAVPVRAPMAPRRALPAAGARSAEAHSRAVRRSEGRLETPRSTDLGRSFERDSKRPSRRPRSLREGKPEVAWVSSSDANGGAPIGPVPYCSHRLSVYLTRFRLAAHAFALTS